MRRGNTLVTNKSSTIIARKGLPKFFDLKVDYVSIDGRYEQDENTKNYQLAGIKKSILEGQSVELIKSLKANGENV